MSIFGMGPGPDIGGGYNGPGFPGGGGYGDISFGGGGGSGGGGSGGLGDLFRDLGLLPTDSETETAPTMTSEQIDFLNQLAEFGGENFENLFNQFGNLAGGLGNIMGGTADLRRQSAELGERARNYESTFVGLDRDVLSGEFSAIDEQTRQNLGNALGGAERFSSGNQIIRGRLAQDASIQKSQLLGGLMSRNAEAEQQANQFQQNIRLSGQQQSISQQSNLYGLDLQANTLASNIYGQQMNMLTAGLGVSPYENINTPGQQGVIPTIVGVGGGIALGGALSDKRLKKETGNVETGLDEVLKMEGKKWNWKEGLGADEEKENEGFMAQDIEKIIPNAVNKSEGGIRSINIYALIPTLVNAIKELNKKIEVLEG